MRTAELCALPLESFLAKVGGVYEKSPWIAEKVYGRGPFASLTSLAEALRQIVDDSSPEEQVALLCAHPDLAGKAALAGELTAESTSEQRRAGLGSLSAPELARFTAMNEAYRAKFRFPFILAVRHASKRTILRAFAARLEHSAAEEQAEAVRQVHKIAWMRLRELLEPEPTGKLTCHVLDTARGVPAAGMLLSLRRQGEGEGEAWELLGEFETNADGRLGGAAVEGARLLPGTYEWTFDVGDYFAAAGVPTAGTPFLQQVPLRFGVDNPEAHYHVPLLCSPWSYSTYRGS
ncbi:hypothetical protein AB1Y20_014783 [Prymnesium parvum]|uniref:Parahox neighbor n=1 Tax=Prymnesium parvum TaxID=97485 RepID=A0AB34IBV9_PRYPA